MVGHIQREKWGDLVVVGGDNQAVRRLGLEHKWRAGRGEEGCDAEIICITWLLHRTRSPEGGRPKSWSMCF